MVIVRRYTKKNLTRTFASKFGGRLPINKINSSRDSFSPKMRRNKRCNEKCASSLDKMAMFTFSNTILSMSTCTRELSKCALGGEKLAKS